MHTIVSAKPLGNYRLEVTFEDGSTKEIDVSGTLMRRASLRASYSKMVSYVSWKLFLASIPGILGP